MMNVSFDGVGQVCATFLGGGLQEGQVVKLAGNGQVGACGDGEGFCGAAICCKDDACTVQVGGFVTLAYSGTAPAVGRTGLCGDGLGGVRSAVSAASGTAKSTEGTADEATGCLVVSVDTTAKTVTILL